VARPEENTARYYEEVLRNLADLMSLLREDNMMMSELLKAMRQAHQVNIGIHENIRKIKFNTQ
jgi:hypothetical protein